MNILDQYVLNEHVSIRNAIKQMDANGQGIVIINNNDNHVKGIVTDGDFRRAVLNGIDLENEVAQITNPDFHYLYHDFTEEDITTFFSNSIYKHAIIIKDKELINLITKEDYLSGNNKVADFPKLDLPVIIMAGGQGKRLEPFTHILPKPLIPIGKKPMIQLIMDEYAKYGLNDFFVSVNFKKHLIKAYFEEEKLDYNISYIEEDIPLGTAGALKLLHNRFETPFFVSNCDIIIKDDYSKIVEFHNNGQFDLTLVASLIHHTIPYGICKLNNDGSLSEIEEKPTLDYLANTGMYLLNPDVLQYIPHNKFYHITHLIADLQKAGKKIGIFPVSEKAWFDVGEWHTFKNTLETIK